MGDTLIERTAVLPPRPDSPAAARELLRGVLDECRRPEWRDAAELALSELTTNALLHAHSPTQIRIRCGEGMLRVEVSDDSAVVPRQRSYGSQSSTGRGLALVAALVSDHGFRSTDTGKVVWFTLTDTPVEPTGGDVDGLLDAWDDCGVPGRLAPDPGTRTVTLVGFPPTLWIAAAEMHDAMLRELALLRSGRDSDGADLAGADRARFAIRVALDAALADGRAKAQSRNPLPAGHPATLQEVPPVLDLEFPVWREAAADFATLQDVLDEANRLAVQGRLLTRPSLPEVVAVRDWAAEQVISSLSGQAPMAWTGADADYFSEHQDQAVREIDYDVAGVVGGPRTAIVVDAQNRILGISVPLAQEIGWQVDDLVGRRVVAIVPPRFREAHVSGLTRHLSTGQAHALRVDLRLPVLRADGTELLCDFWIDADRSPAGLAIYIAYVSPVSGTTSTI